VGKDSLDWSKVFAAALSEDVDRVTSKEESVDPATARPKARQGAGVSAHQDHALRVEIRVAGDRFDCAIHLEPPRAFGSQPRIEGLGGRLVMARRRLGQGDRGQPKALGVLPIGWLSLVFRLL
jgi:hypothetical protein